MDKVLWGRGVRIGKSVLNSLFHINYSTACQTLTQSSPRNEVSYLYNRSLNPRTLEPKSLKMWKN